MKISSKDPFKEALMDFVFSKYVSLLYIRPWKRTVVLLRNMTMKSSDYAVMDFF